MAQNQIPPTKALDMAPRGILNILKSSDIFLPVLAGIDKVVPPVFPLFGVPNRKHRMSYIFYNPYSWVEKLALSWSLSTWPPCVTSWYFFFLGPRPKWVWHSCLRGFIKPLKDFRHSGYCSPKHFSQIGLSDLPLSNQVRNRKIFLLSKHFWKFMPSSTQSRNACLV